MSGSIREIDHVTREGFHTEVLTAAEPVVMRGLVGDWPLVQAGRQSAEALGRYLGERDRGAPVGAMMGPPSIGGRFTYNADFSGFNFRRTNLRLSDAVDMLLDYRDDARPSALAVQSAPVRELLNGFEADNPMPLLDAEVEPRVWLGNAVTVAAHQDPSENIACVVAGRRRFTLFPPEQVANLYVGPFELTPAGAPISLVDFDSVDTQRFPRFAEALEHAVTAELGPGDAIYIPYLWWHQVRSVEPVNMLVNYWWAGGNAGRGRAIHALMHAMMSLRNMPVAHRDAWRAMFDHYVFNQTAGDADHVPSQQRGVIGQMDEHALRGLKTFLAQSLAKPE